MGWMRIGGGVEEAGQIPFKDMDGLIAYQAYLFILYVACVHFILKYHSNHATFLSFTLSSTCNFFEGLDLN